MDVISNENTKNLRDNNLANNPFVSGYEVDVLCDSNGLIRLARDQPMRGAVVLESDFPVGVTVAYNRNGYALLRVTRLWEFLDRIDISQSTTSATFNATLSDLDSEVPLPCVARSADER